jgi:hypothetical protein
MDFVFCLPYHLRLSLPPYHTYLLLSGDDALRTIPLRRHDLLLILGESSHPHYCDPSFSVFSGLRTRRAYYPPRLESFGCRGNVQAVKELGCGVNEGGGNWWSKSRIEREYESFQTRDYFLGGVRLSQSTSTFSFILNTPSDSCLNVAQ